MDDESLKTQGGMTGTSGMLETQEGTEDLQDLSTWFWNNEDQAGEDPETRRLKFLRCAGFKLERIDEQASEHVFNFELDESKHELEESQEESETDQWQSWSLSSGSSVSPLSSEGFLDVEIDSEDFFDLEDYYESESDISLASGSPEGKKQPNLSKLAKRYESAGIILDEPAEGNYGYGEPFSQFMSRLYKLGNIEPVEDDEKDSDEDDMLSSEEECEYIRGSNDVESCSGWRKLSFLPDPWAEARYPTTQFITREELSSENLKRSLNTIMIASGLTNLTVPPGCTRYCCTKLQLQGMGIRSIELLSKYKYLQYIDLSMNEIKELNPLWDVHCLVVLDVSYNFVNECSFGSPQNILFLTYLNLSHNDFTQIPDLSQCWSLKHLNLSHNKIKYIENLENLDFLEYLNISSNELEGITNLTNPQLMEVDFSYNQITGWSNPSPSALTNLKIVNIASNLLPSLRIFKHMYNLRKFDASNNEFCSMSDFEFLRTFPRMEDLQLHGNELMKIIADARRLIIYYMPSLKRLDDSLVSSMERVSSQSTFAMNSMDSMLVQDSLSFYSMHCQNPTVGWERKKPVGQTQGLILLVGFLGSLREEIVRKAFQMCPHKIRVVRQTTTRPGVKNPSSQTLYSTNLFYKHVSQTRFYKKEERGDFVVSYLELGYKFGFESSDLECSDKVSLTLVSMSAALGLIWQGFQPYVYLVFPESSDILTTRLCTWFRNTHVFRCDSHTRLIRGRRKRRRRKRTLTGLHLGDEGTGFSFRSISGVGGSAIREVNEKRLSRRKHRHSSKRLHRMFTTARSISRTMFGRKTHRFGRRRSHTPSMYSIYSTTTIKQRKENYFRDPIFQRNMEHIFTRGLRAPFTEPWCEISERKKVAFKGAYSTPPGSPSIASRPSFISRDTREESTYSAYYPDLRETRSDHDELTRFVKNIFKLRQSCREMHRKNPGFFHSYIPSDDTTEAAKILAEKVDEIYEKLMQSKRIADDIPFRDSPHFEDLVMSHVNKYIDEIRTHHIPRDIL